MTMIFNMEIHSTDLETVVVTAMAIIMGIVMLYIIITDRAAVITTLIIATQLGDGIGLLEIAFG